MPAHIFDWIAVVVFTVAAIPYPAPNAPLNLIALGLDFLTLGHIFP